MPKYYKDAGCGPGEVTTVEDPDRAYWAGTCTYWTDDWDKVSASDGIPCCPTCKAPGFIGKMSEWLNGAERYEAEGNPGYVKFLNNTKEVCHRMGLADFWGISKPK